MPVKTAQPKAERLWTQMRRLIMDGRLKPGDALPTQRQLGEAHGVAEATAALALSRLVQEGLVVRKRGKGTFVTNSVLTTVTAINFVRVSEEPGAVRSAAVLTQIERCNEIARQRGFRCDWHHLPLRVLREPERVADEFAVDTPVIGFSVPVQFMRMLFGRGIPVVSAMPRHGDPPVGAEPFVQIDVDRRDIARLAVEHLLNLGHRRIAYVGRSVMSPRAVGFIEAVRQYALNIPLDWVVEASNRFLLDAMDRLHAIFTGPDRPEAVVAMTDHDGAVLQSILLQMGLRVPQDVAMIAGDVGPDAERADVPLTTVGPDWVSGLHLAVDAAVALAPGFDPLTASLRRPDILPAVVTPRASTANPAASGYHHRQSTGKEVLGAAVP